MSWARKYDGCIECGTTSIEHKEHGLCNRCRNRKWWREHRGKGQDYNYKKWSAKHHLDACVKCKSSKFRHWGRGLCERCFRSEKGKREYQKYKDQYKARSEWNYYKHNYGSQWKTAKALRETQNNIRRNTHEEQKRREFVGVYKLLLGIVSDCNRKRSNANNSKLSV